MLDLQTNGGWIAINVWNILTVETKGDQLCLRLVGDYIVTVEGGASKRDEIVLAITNIMDRGMKR